MLWPVRRRQCGARVGHQPVGGVARGLGVLRRGERVDAEAEGLRLDPDARDAARSHLGHGITQLVAQLWAASSSSVGHDSPSPGTQNSAPCEPARWISESSACSEISRRSASCGPTRTRRACRAGRPVGDRGRRHRAARGRAWARLRAAPACRRSRARREVDRMPRVGVSALSSASALSTALDRDVPRACSWKNVRAPRGTRATSPPRRARARAGGRRACAGPARRDHLDGSHHRVLQPFDVVRVDPHRGAQFIGGAGELAQDQHAAVVDARGDVLLRDEVHAVAERGHEHDVGGEEQRDHLLARVRLVQVADRGVAHRVEVAVDAPDGQLDLVAELDVRVDALPAGARDLHEGHVLDPQPAFGRAARRMPSAGARCPWCSRAGPRPRKIRFGLPRLSRISPARAFTSSRCASSMYADASIEIGNARASASRVVPSGSAP